MLRWRTSYFIRKTNSFCFSYTFFPIWKAYMYNISLLLLKNTSFGIPTLLILSKSFPSKNDWICQYFENICKTNNLLVWATVIHFFFFFSVTALRFLFRYSPLCHAVHVTLWKLEISAMLFSKAVSVSLEAIHVFVVVVVQGWAYGVITVNEIWVKICHFCEGFLGSSILYFQ